MFRSIAASALLLAAPLPAQDPSGRTIQVTGTGIVQTPPDVALIELWVRGEGTTADAAASALAAKQKAIAGGVGALLGTGTEITTGNVVVIEARDPACADARGYGSQPRLSQGTCTVTGFVATMQGGIRTRAVAKAGTAAALAARLGASDARLQGFALADPDAAQRRAGTAAIRDARVRAEAIASGANVRLGPLMTLRDQATYTPQTVFAAADPSFAPPAPAAPPAPVAIDVAARPIETRAQVYATYAITPIDNAAGAARD